MAVEVIELMDSDDDDVQVNPNNNNGEDEDGDIEEVEIARAVRRPAGNEAPAGADDDEDLVVTGASRSKNKAPQFPPSRRAKG